ncbi:ATP-binding protein [Geitlerinema sp. PCC 9228]|uniref:ATP-binding protein n=1 Tax=Geitlerinema sp. PCC 9228 TaxID=111611 RepID=UPI0008F9D001|nr:ATP-binding protein [Geitlerinema sp. PCC 9228]
MSVRENKKLLPFYLRKYFPTFFHWMERANHLSIRDKLSLGFGLLVVVTFLVVGRSYLASIQANKTIKQTQESYAPAAIASSTAQKNLLRMLSNLRGYLATGKSSFRDRYQDARHNFERDIAELQTLLSQSPASSEKQNLQELADTYKTWSKLPEQLFALYDNTTNNQPAFRVLQQQGTPLISRITRDTSQLIALQENKNLSTSKQAKLLQDLIQFRSAFLISVSSMRGYIVTRHPFFRSDYITHIKENQEIWQRLQNQQSLFNPSQQKQFKKLTQNWNQLRDLEDTIFAIVESEKHRRDLFLLRTEAEPQAEKMLALLDKIVTIQQTTLTQELQSGSNALFAAQWQILLASIVAFLFGGSMALVLRRRIAHPIERLTEMTASMMGGNFQTRIDIETHDEIGKLAATFNSMSESLARSQAQLQEYNQTLETKVVERTQQLEAKNVQLAETLQELQNTQMQLIQAEKLSGLGQLVAGVAHEINNPINFIHGNVIHTQQYTQDLLALVELYCQTYPDGNAEIEAFVEEIDLPYLRDDLPKVLSSMQAGTERIRNIVRSLRVFSRLDESEIKDIDLHESIDSTLAVFQSRLQKNRTGLPIDVVKDYGMLPFIRCYAGQLNQVFANILNNAIDALEEKFSRPAFADAQATWEDFPMIRIYTRVTDSQYVTIGFVDNGIGIPEEIRHRIFDPFFTTKTVGKGTGLGMSISHQIITQQHQGQLLCSSIPKRGTEITIYLPIQQT